MGVQYSATVVCGFEVEQYTKAREVEKFNERTGELYTSLEESGFVTKIGGKVMDIEAMEPDIDAEFLVEATLDGLEFGESGYEEGQLYLGVQIRNIDGCNGTETVKAFSTEVPSLVKTFAENHGIEPKFMLVMSCG